MADFKDIILLHHVENLREHLLLSIQRVKIDLYSQKTLHPESSVAVEGHVSDMEKSMSGCYACHHVPDVVERLDDLRQQVEQYTTSINRAVSHRKQANESYHKIPVDAQIIGDSLISKVDTMVVASSEKLRERTEVSLRKAHATKLVMVVLLAAGPLMMIVFAFTVMSGVTGARSDPASGNKTAEKGRSRPSDYRAADEFGELAVAFNDMAGALHETMQGH